MNCVTEENSVDSIDSSLCTLVLLAQYQRGLMVRVMDGSIIAWIVATTIGMVIFLSNTFAWIVPLQEWYYLMRGRYYCMNGIT